MQPTGPKHMPGRGHMEEEPLNPNPRWPGELSFFFFISCASVTSSEWTLSRSQGLQCSHWKGMACDCTQKPLQHSRLDGWLGNITKEVSVAILLSQWAAAGGPHASRGCDGNL